MAKRVEFVAFATAALVAVCNAGATTADEGEFPAEVWLNAGLLSLHYDRNADFNEVNTGIGGEYRWTPSSALTAGFFRNSNRQRSHYLGGFWQPIPLGIARLGVAFGAIDGYPLMRGGGWFPIVVPALSAESGRFGANLLAIPSYKDRLNGALSLQLKWRVH